MTEGPGLVYAEFGTKNAPAAFHLTNAEKVFFQDVTIDWATDSPNWKFWLMAENSEIVEINSGCDFGKTPEKELIPVIADCLGSLIFT